jgi:hypothetical protein
MRDTPDNYIGPAFSELEELMAISRRTFLANTAATLGAVSIANLSRDIQFRGRPILITPKCTELNLHVYEGGLITLGPESPPTRIPTWREVWQVEGIDVGDPRAIAAALKHTHLDLEELDRPVSDVCWEMVWSTTWCPAAQAEKLLKRLKIGPTLRSKAETAGRLNFHYADNHPGSNEIWVEVPDDLSISLLQARLIELRQPIRIVMEVSTLGVTSNKF